MYDEQWRMLLLIEVTPLRGSHTGAKNWCHQRVSCRKVQRRHLNAADIGEVDQNTIGSF